MVMILIHPLIQSYMNNLPSKFGHLENNNLERETSWTDDLLTNGLPKRAFTNPITSMFVLLLEDFLKVAYQRIDDIKNWWEV